MSRRERNQLVTPYACTMSPDPRSHSDGGGSHFLPLSPMAEHPSFHARSSVEIHRSSSFFFVPYHSALSIIPSKGLNFTSHDIILADTYQKQAVQESVQLIK